MHGKWRTLACLCLLLSARTFLDAQAVSVSLEGKDIVGYGILKRVPGLWNGPVSSTTPAGSFAEWYVDFRPVSPGQVSQYSTLDAQTQNFISFFIVRHNGGLKVAMRTEGVFQNKGCVTYEVVEAADESKGYYRFSDFQSGNARAYTEFTFAGDEMLMEVHTNKFNTVHPLQVHSTWRARRADAAAAAPAAAYWGFPRPVMIKDFTDAFRGMHESIFFTFENDPYSSATQPYVGEVAVTISIDKDLTVEPHHELFLLLTTESLFEGLRYVKDRLKYISRCVYLAPDTRSYTFKNVHPGRYYLYSYDDLNNDRLHTRGDYMSSDIATMVDLPPNGRVTVDARIDMIIP